MKGKPAALAKTTGPSLSGILLRRRLFALLERGCKSSVAWVTGPPGCGKTTLVGSYLDSRKLSHIWYELDAGDADVATFFYYMGLAAAKYIDSRLPLLTPEYHAGVSAFARRYFRKLYEQLTPPFALVLENYHEVPPQSDLHGILPELLSEVPPKACVIVISRHEPPPSVARLLASGRMRMIGWSDLQLTLGETKGIIKLRGIKLPRATLTQLYHKTQGWAAGLTLMLGQARDGRFTAQLPEGAGSTPRLIFDYLAGEIFEKLEPAVREFGLKIAVFPQMTAHMAEALTGVHTAARLLADGYRNNYFINLKQAQPEPVYEYHPLVREFLLARASKIFTDAQRADLQRQTAVLLEGAGQLEAAVGLLSELNDWQEMTRLLLEHAASMLQQGRGQTLSQWLEDLPPEVLEQTPWALYWLGACRLSFAPRESRNLYERAFNIFASQSEPNLKGPLLACCGIMDAILYELDDLTLLDRWIAELNRLLQQHPHFPAENVGARVTSSMCLALLLRQPHHPDIGKWLERATQISQSLVDPSERMLLELIVAVEAMWTGDFARALEIITAQRQLSQSPTVSPLALTSLKNIESMYYMLTAERDPCLAAMEEGLRIARETGVYIWSNQFLVNGAAGALGAGDFENADKLLNEAQAHAEGARRLDMCLYHYCRGWEAMLHRDNLRAFQEHKQALKLAIDVGSPYFEVQCRMALSQALFHYDDERRVVSHLREVHRVARKIHNYLLEFMCLLGYAQLALARGRRRSGLNSLRYALALGRERGYKHFLGWQPKVMAELCVYALDAGIEAEYVKELIRKRSLVPEASPISVQDWPWGFKIFTLGQFQLLKQDQIVTFAGKAQRRPMDLLRALIAFGAKEVNDDRLTEALWPRIDHDFAHRSFTTTLHRLRKLLGEDKMLVLKDGRLSLDARYCWLDMWALEDVLTRSERLLAGREGRISAEQVAELADKVLDLYRGPFMHSEADRSWYVSPRERLRTKFLRTMAEFARYWEGDGEWTKAVEYYQKALEADELAEGLYRHLMICYQRLGRRGEAIETYNRCRQTLSTMLNIEPSAETKGLYETLLRNV